MDAARRHLSADENDPSSSSRAYFGTASNETGVRALKAVIAVGVIVTGLNLWMSIAPLVHASLTGPCKQIEF